MNKEEQNYDAEELQAQDALAALEARKKEQVRKKKARRIRQIIIAIIIILLMLILAYCGYEKFRPRSRWELDQSALEGFLPGKSDEEIQAELNRIIDESRFNVTINTLITVEDGEADVRIENVPANNYYMQVDLYVYPEQNNTENTQLLYQSGVIQQGHYIEKAKVKTSLPAGYYDAVAVFHALYPDETMDEVGSTSMNAVVQVK